MPKIGDCIVLHGPNLEPRHCARFMWSRDTISAIDLGPPASTLEHGAIVIIPGLTNALTCLGDSALADGASGLDPAQTSDWRAEALASIPLPIQYQHVLGHLLYAGRSGTVRHLDHCAPGHEPPKMLRAAARESGLESILFGSLAFPPLSEGDPIDREATLPATLRAQLEAIFAVTDGIVASGLPVGASREVHHLAEERQKLRCLPCPSPRFAESLESFAPQLAYAQADTDDAAIATLVATRLPAVITPRADASRGLALPPIGALLRAGVPLLLGTGSAMHTAPNLFAEMNFAWMIARLQAGDAPPPPPAAILRMATGNIQAVLGPACTGSLERGLPADFVVLDFRHPHLCGTRDLLASVVSRVTPDDVVATYRQGEPLWRLPDFNP